MFLSEEFFNEHEQFILQNEKVKHMMQQVMAIEYSRNWAPDFFSSQNPFDYFSKSQHCRLLFANETEFNETVAIYKNRI